MNIIILKLTLEEDDTFCRFIDFERDDMVVIFYRQDEILEMIFDQTYYTILIYNIETFIRKELLNAIIDDVFWNYSFCLDFVLERSGLYM